MKSWLKPLKWIALGAAALSFTAAGAQQLFSEGTDYQRLPQPQPVESGAKIEVIEFFSYGCIHCSHLEEHLGPWAAKVPADVSFKRVPVVFQAAWEPLAKIYYTLETLGKEHELTPKVFQAIHGANIRLWEEKNFFDWASNNGLDATKVKEAWNSFSVNSKMNRARTLARNYRVQSTPILFIDGKYVLQSGALKGGHKDAPAALDFLIAKARSERKS